MTQLEKKWQQSMLPPSCNIGQAIQNLNDVSVRIVLITDQQGRLQGTVSDGDIRRGLLKGLSLDSPITSIINTNALVAPPDLNRELVIQLMMANKIHQIPVVDKHHRIVGLHLWDEITVPPKRSNLLVIMAGGMGKRMQPHTENCPKPLLAVAGKPIVQHIIERAKLEGFNHFIIAIHYLGNMIEDYFGNGEILDVKIEYLREESPLGTAGALGLLSTPLESPIIVTNGDVITDIRYGELLDFHIRNNASATMAVSTHKWQHPFGVVQTKGLEIIGFEEKPIIHTYVNAGVYVLDPSALTELTVNEYCDMPILFERMQSKLQRTVAYPMHEPWLDVGKPDDLILANEMHKI